jgi:hypothetical protein
VTKNRIMRVHDNARTEQLVMTDDESSGAKGGFSFPPFGETLGRLASQRRERMYILCLLLSLFSTFFGQSATKCPGLPNWKHVLVFLLVFT